MTDIEARLRAALKSALRERDADRLAALRQALSALDNAGSVPVDPTPTTAGSQHVAAAVGVGAAEVARRELDEDAGRAVVTREIDDLLAAADELATAAPARAATLRRQARLLTDLRDHSGT